MAVKILVRYGEIALKGRNRSFFERKLFDNIKASLRGLGAGVARLHGRFLVTGPDSEKDEIIGRLSRVFGVVSVSSVATAPLDPEAVQKKVLELLDDRPLPGESFKVEARRSNKNFPLTSPELNRIIGAAILAKHPRLKVDLHEPSFRVFIEIGAGEAYLYQGSTIAVSYTHLLQGVLFCSLLIAAAGWDLQKRMIPDSICILIFLTGLINFSPVNFLGALLSLPFFLAAWIDEKHMAVSYTHLQALL